MQPDVQPLATIEYQGVAWPVAWTRTFGKGRVFHTVLGHRDFGPDKDDPLRDPNLSRLIIQGMDWVAAGRPTSEQTLKGRIKLACNVWPDLRTGAAIMSHGDQGSYSVGRSRRTFLAATGGWR